MGETAVVSVDGSDTSKAAVEWCADHLDKTTKVIAVSSLGSMGEFVNSLPGFDMASTESIRETFRSRWCAPLAEAGLDWTSVFAHQTQPAALADVIESEHPDLVVIGKPTHLTTDVILGGQLRHALHHAACPVVVVPAVTSDEDQWKSRRSSHSRSRSDQSKNAS
jgi:nucleotide-binding universal stress UspA family protein